LTTSDRDAAAALGRAIAQRIGEPRYLLWFERNTKITWDGGQLTVGVPNLFFQGFLQSKFADEVSAAAREVLARPVQVRFAIDPDLVQAAHQGQAANGVGPAAPVPADSPGPPKPRALFPDLPDAAPRPPAEARPRAKPQRGRRWHRLADFVIGPCNRVAHAAALSVIEAPGQGPNPLVLHGPVGTGKTHLLEGVYAGLRKNHGDWRVCFTTSEEFTNRFVQAMRLGKLAAFRKHFRECDALLVDDLQFLAGKRATEEEFLHTFDVLHGDGKTVVVTCDCHPRLTDQYTPELADRLVGGAVWGLTPPDEATRLDLLRAKSAGDLLFPVPEEVLRFLAGQLRGNVRELEGALHCTRHLGRVTGRPVDLDLAREAVGDLIRHAVRVVQPADVDRAVCRALRLEAGALQSKQRAWMVCHPRMLAMYLARKHTPATYGEIGSYFGKRNHSTAVAAEKKVRQWLNEDSVLSLGERPVRVRDLVALIERELLG
jgi:chromosomal replication initiator protein